MELIDIGCNLTHDSFDADREEVIERARAAGVALMVVTGASAAGSRMASELALAHPGVLFATAGVHPHRAASYDAETDALLRELATRDEVVAAGETGLDYFRNFSPREAQLAAFEAQLQIAIDSGLPAFLHLRDAHEDFHALLKASRERLSDVVVHCFTGSRDELRAYLDLDCHIGITGWICDERRGVELRTLVREVPVGRLMLETDAPYLTPRDLHPQPRARRNEPAFLPHILRAVAAARGETVEALAAATTDNARRFFAMESTRNA